MASSEKAASARPENEDFSVSLPNSPNRSGKSWARREGVYAGIGAGVITFVIIVVIFIIWMRRKRKYGSLRASHPGSPIMSFNITDDDPTGWIAPLGYNKRIYTQEELSAATNGFSEANLVGRGGFGDVYRGVLPNNKEIAVKRLRSGSRQGHREFKSEIRTISHLHHRHLVSLVGYHIHKSQSMLVYPYMPNKTLEYHLHVNNEVILDWQKRLTVSIGAAKGLAYLHEDCTPPVIHRDVKTANILLDNDFEARVADFGFAQLKHTENNIPSSVASAHVMGTVGYIAPEYHTGESITQKVDVFSYGVMLMELITGLRPTNVNGTTDTLHHWARPILKRVQNEGGYDTIVDARLSNNYGRMQMTLMIGCALACTRDHWTVRPKMSVVHRVLEGISPLSDLDDVMREHVMRVF